MNAMDKLPTVISCCFCCFLRAGTVMIALFSFISGIIFAPNVTFTKGFWNIDPVLSYYSAATENVLQVTLGVLSIFLCVISIFLLVGALCNIPTLILIYQWGAVLYGILVFVMLFILAMFCFFVHTSCALTGVMLFSIMIFEVLVTMYFVLVANSLRHSLIFLRNQSAVL